MPYNHWILGAMKCLIYDTLFRRSVAGRGEFSRNASRAYDCYIVGHLVRPRKNVYIYCWLVTWTGKVQMSQYFF